MIDRAEGEGDKVFKWILIHSDKPRKTGASKDDKPAAAVAAKAAPKSVAKSDDPLKPTTTATVGVSSATSGAPAAATATTAKQPALAAAPAGPANLPRATTTAAVDPAAASLSAASSPDAKADTSAPADTRAASIPVADTPAKEVAGSTFKQDAAERPATASPSSVARAPADAATDDSASETLRPIKRVDPKLPLNMWASARGGHVEVHFTVQPDGSVSDATAGVATNRRLISYAVEAVAQWKFAPLKRPQTAAVDLVFDFD